MDLTKLFDLSYLFEKFPQAGFSWPMRIVLLVLFIGSLVLAIYANRKTKNKNVSKKLWQKIQVWSWTNGLAGLVFIYFREVRAIYLSSRGWLLLFLIIMFVWLVFIVKFAKTKLPNKEELEKKEQEFDRWLPKKK